jgi:nickel/cobalt transporter regulator
LILLSSTSASQIEKKRKVGMLRIIAIAAMLALAVPTLAVAQGNNQQHHPGGGKPPGGGGKPPARVGEPQGGAKPFVQPHAGPRPGFGGAHPGPGGPRPGGLPVAGHQFSWHGRSFNRIHLAPFVYPSGWEYRRWAAGAILPPLFLAPAYYYADWASLGLDPPPPGFQWVRYGPDLLLVNVTTGQVVETIYDAFE